MLIYESCSLASNKQKSLLCILTISFITAMFYALRRHIGKGLNTNVPANVLSHLQQAKCVSSSLPSQRNGTKSKWPLTSSRLSFPLFLLHLLTTHFNMPCCHFLNSELLKTTRPSFLPHQFPILNFLTHSLVPWFPQFFKSYLIYVTVDPSISDFPEK